MTLTEAQQTLRDTLRRPLRDLRISVIDKCNFRCPYCMPEERYHANYQFLRNGELLTFEEIGRLARIFAALGARKLRITGGEPLLRRGLPDLVRDLAAIGEVDDLALTTNGVYLGGCAHALREAGLSRLTVSLDSVDDGLFRRMNGNKRGIAPVLEGVAAARTAGFQEIKFNCVVQRGVNCHALLELVEHFRWTGHILRFIEYMDVGTCNDWRRDHVVPSREVLGRIHARYPVTPLEENYHGEVAARYAFDDGAGEIGFISSVTAPFCGACTRARLGADGVLYTCLFAARGTDLRTPLRQGASDADIAGVIAAVWENRGDRYSELRARRPAEPAARRRIEMYQIGG